MIQSTEHAPQQAYLSGAVAAADIAPALILQHWGISSVLTPFVEGFLSQLSLLNQNVLPLMEPKHWMSPITWKLSECFTKGQVEEASRKAAPVSLGNVDGL